LREILPPTLASTVGLGKKVPGLEPARMKPHTRITYVPAYAELGYKSGLTPKDAEEIETWLRLRTHQSAAYVGPKVEVSFNGQRCATTSVESLAALIMASYGEDAERAIMLTGAMKSTNESYKPYPWNVVVIVLPPGIKAGRRASAQNMMVVNGVLCNKGSHVLHIKKMLGAAIEDKVRKLTKNTKSKDKAKAKDKDDAKSMTASKLLEGVRLVMCGALPGADWGGQRKDELQVDAEIIQGFEFTATFLKKVADAVGEQILIAQGAKPSKAFAHTKYTVARHAGKAKKSSTYLLAAEGDSAITLLKAGLKLNRSAPPGGPSLEWCGIISLQGVILNAAREVKEIATNSGEPLLVRSAKLQNSPRLLALADAWGLKYNCKYESKAERETLNYGKLVLCVDQDLDGTGKIAPLVLVWIWLFWPALIINGCVGRFMTPLIRAYPKKGPKIPIEFFYEVAYKEWVAEDPERAKEYDILYFKGLGGHEAHDVARMFTHEEFRRNIYTYSADEATKKLFDVFYGADPALRKAALVTPVRQLTKVEAEKMRIDRKIPVGQVQLDIDSKLYKNDAIKRQIPGGVDGLNPARRKVGAALGKRFAKSKKPIKVFQLGGFVADVLLYHHGDVSLNGTIVTMTQSHIGARKYPYLIGAGQFGDRHGEGAASARYVSVSPSPLFNATFPPDDRWFLRYVFEDGERAEPWTYVPVAPMTALEGYSIVSEGWNHDSYSRDFDAVMKVVDAYLEGNPALHALADRLVAAAPRDPSETLSEIKQEPIAHVLADIQKESEKWPLPACTRGQPESSVRSYKGIEYSFGAYEWDEKKQLLRITELPIGVATERYLETLSKEGRPNARSAFIKRVDDVSMGTTIDIRITLYEGSYEKICADYGDAEIDPIEDAFVLRESLRPHLNYYSSDGGVLEFGMCYLATILYWAPHRRDLYLERAERERIVAELRILEETETLRYISMAAELDLSNIDDEALASEKLEASGFQKLHTGLLHQPKYTPNTELKRLVMEGPKASYDYLLDLKGRALLRSAVAVREKAIATHRAILSKVEKQLCEEPIPCASVWRAELDNFKAVVASGIASNWFFGASKNVSKASSRKREEYNSDEEE